MLERHTFSLQSAQLTRPRNYILDYEYEVRQPRNAPEWTFDAQNIPVGTDFSAPNTPDPEGDGDGEGNGDGQGDEKGGGDEELKQ